MAQPPKLSALISTYNSEQLIASRITNLLQQQQDDLLIEIIVIDSGSEEDERSPVSNLRENNANIKYLRTENETLYAAWNRAIAMASGQYITNANTDDRFFAGAIAKMIEQLDRDESIALVYADVYQTIVLNEIIEFDGISKSSRWKRINRPDYSHKELLLGCLCGPQPIWRRSLHDRYGLFDADFVVAGDYEFWLRIAEHWRFLHLPEPLGLVYKNTDGLEWRNRKRLAEENLIIRKRYFSLGQI